jgi:hypothetical protein
VRREVLAFVDQDSPPVGLYFFAIG